MGSHARHITTAAAIASVIALAACSGDGGDDMATSADTMPASADAATAPAEDAGGSSGGGAELAPLEVADRDIALEARASLQTDDVRSAVEQITARVATGGGRVAAADIDYVSDGPEGDRTGSRATLVLEVPPDELHAIVDSFDAFGTVLSFDQFAEDVTDQLADLDTRIANMRASIERVRALYAEATDIDSIVRLEAELTQRETALEQLLASQQALADRVAMSTLTVDVAASAEALGGEDDDPGIVDALGAGWSAFVGGLFAIVLVLAAAAPFVMTAIVVALVVLWVLQAVRRRTPVTQERQEQPEPVSASRQG